MDPDPWPTTDPLGEALHVLRMNGAYYCRSELRAPWGVMLPPKQRYMWFHVVTDGECWLETDRSQPRHLSSGAFALLPHGEGHVLRSEATTPAPSVLDLPLEQINDRYDVLRCGGGGALTTMVCGAVRFQHPAARDLVRLMPKVIHVDAAATRIDSTLSLMAAEAKALQTGAETVIARLADVLVIQAIRSWIDIDPVAHGGWLGALNDPQIGRAILLMHRGPGRAWTVASLADEVAMSRSAFAVRFTELVGETPMGHLARWRMYIALDWLRDDGVTIAEAASRLGYRSEAAFSRAFKRIMGTPPRSVKRGGPATADGRPGQHTF